MLSYFLALTVSIVFTTKSSEKNIADYLQILTQYRDKTAQTQVRGQGTFSVKTDLGFFTVAMTAAVTPGKLYLCTGNFLWAPSLTILVGRKNTFILFNGEKQGMLLRSSDDRFISESTGHDLGLTPWALAELLVGHVPHFHQPIFTVDHQKDQFWVAEKENPEFRYLIDIKNIVLLEVEDKKHDWQIKLGGWTKLPQGEIPTSWRLLLGGEEKLIVHLYQIDEFSGKVSFLPPLGFQISPYQPGEH